MSGLESWEDDVAAQDENLSSQTQKNLNINGQAPNFRPGASSFQPEATSFQPGQQYGVHNHHSTYGQPQGDGGFSQYGQQKFHTYSQQQQPQQPYRSQGSFNQGYEGQFTAYGQNPGSFQSQQQPTQAPVSIAKRTDSSHQFGQASAPPTTSTNSFGSSASAAPKAKVLSPGPEGTPSKTKVLSIGVPPAASTATTKADSLTSSVGLHPEEGSKVAATKAVDKSKEKTTKSSGKTSPSLSNEKPSSIPGDKKTALRDADTVLKEQTADVDEETLQEVYGKEHVNLIFIGHVDAGKSTLGGSILYATGMVDERTMEKYKKEAKDAGRETWYLSWALDLTKEERAKGKTVEVGRGFFETEKRRYTILDAPGHKTFVPNMIGGASQADVGILVISARKGEYETGFEKGGQTREHAMLAKTQGVSRLVVVVNKMDDPTVEWSKDRYEECTSKLTQFLKGVGYNPKTDITFMPISAQTSIGIKQRVPDSVAPWYQGPSVLEYLDNMDKLERKINAPFMMPVGGKYRDMGTVIEGRIESGAVKKGSAHIMMPNREETSVAALYGETEEEIQVATCGDQVRIRLRGIEEEDILPGFVLCSPKRPVHCVNAFEAQIVILELKSILSAGFNCVLHVHSAIEEITFSALLHKLQKGTNRRSKKPPPFAAKGQSIIARLEVLGGAGRVCVERFEDYPQLGRFTLRDQGQTIAIGKITKLITDGDEATA